MTDRSQVDNEPACADTPSPYLSTVGFGAGLAFLANGLLLVALSAIICAALLLAAAWLGARKDPVARHACLVYAATFTFAGVFTMGAAALDASAWAWWAQLFSGLAGMAGVLFVASLVPRRRPKPEEK